MRAYSVLPPGVAELDEGLSGAGCHPERCYFNTDRGRAESCCGQAETSHSKKGMDKLHLQEHPQRSCKGCLSLQMLCCPPIIVIANTLRVLQSLLGRLYDECVAASGHVPEDPGVRPKWQFLSAWTISHSSRMVPAAERRHNDHRKERLAVHHVLNVDLAVTVDQVILPGSLCVSHAAFEGI